MDWFDPKLRFEGETEKDFRIHYDRESLSYMRLGLLMAAALYGVFGVLDIWIIPQSHVIAWVIRFGIVIPLVLGVLALTYCRRAIPWLQELMSLQSVALGLGIVAMIAVSREGEPGFKYYYAGLLLVIMGIFSLFRLRFLYALTSLLIILSAYEYTAIRIQKLTAGGFSSPGYGLFINNNFFFLSSILIGIVVAYSMEYYIRKDFLQLRIIRAGQDRLEDLLGRMNYELTLAQHIQAQLLPRGLPSVKGVRCGAFYRPMEKVGGDLYDFVRFEEPHLIGLFIGDVSGHGVPAALITSMAKTIINTAGNILYSPPEFIQHMNDKMTGQIGSHFLTAVYGVYDAREMVLRYTRAGHAYPVLLRDGEVVRVQSPGRLIGIIPGLVYQEMNLQLNPGDRLFLFTDGLVEAKNICGEDFGTAIFPGVLQALSAEPIGSLMEGIYGALKEHRGGEEFEDDICILGLEVLSGED